LTCLRRSEVVTCGWKERRRVWREIEIRRHNKPLIPPVQLLHATRLTTNRCLYGILAVASCKGEDISRSADRFTMSATVFRVRTHTLFISRVFCIAPRATACLSTRTTSLFDTQTLSLITALAGNIFSSGFMFPPTAIICCRCHA